MRFQKPFFAYRSFWKELDTVKRFYDAGIREFCVFPSNTTNTLGQPYGQYPPNWLYFDAYEFEHVDRQINDILSAAPEAKLLCMVDLNSPNWLVRQLMYSLCDSTLGVTDALTTERWREETLKYMRALLTHIETAFPGRVKAYILAGGMTDEWMDNSKGREIAAKREAFLEWCGKNNYPVPDSIPDIARRYRSARTARSAERRRLHSLLEVHQRMHRRRYEHVCPGSAQNHTGNHRARRILRLYSPARIRTSGPVPDTSPTKKRSLRRILISSSAPAFTMTARWEAAEAS